MLVRKGAQSLKPSCGRTLPLCCDRRPVLRQLAPVGSRCSSVIVAALASTGRPSGGPSRPPARSPSKPPAKAPAGAAATPAPPRASKKKSKKLVDMNGDVSKDLGNGMFQLKLENGVTIMAHLSGKIRQNRIKIVMGDKVTVELSPYDLTKGRITYRFRPGEYEKLQQAAAEAAAGGTGPPT